MGKDVCRARSQITKTFRQISNEQVFEKLFGETVEISRITYFARDDLHYSTGFSSPWIAGLTFSYSFIGLPSSVKNGGYPACSSALTGESLAHEHLENQHS